MQFDAPSSSPAFIALLNAAENANFERGTIRALLWLINAHPELVAHARVFKHLAVLLESSIFEQLSPTIYPWVTSIPSWIKFCRWVSSNTANLEKKAGLARINEVARAITNHPMMRAGVGRHAVVAALWCEHESSARYPPEDDQTHTIARRYFCLQAHLLLSYIDSRARHTTLEAFESYAEEAEFGRTPGNTAGPGRAFREFSRNVYSQLLAEVDTTLTPDAFLLRIGALRFNGQMIGSADPDDVSRYLSEVQRYFRRYADVRRGIASRSDKRKHQSRSGDGGHKHRHGYVRCPSIDGVYFRKLRQKPEDEDIPWTAGGDVFLFEDDQDGDDALSGLAPDETIQHVFHLYHPHELKSALTQLRYQRLALEMNGQHFCWDYKELTEAEIGNVLAHADECIAAYYGNPRNKQTAYKRLMAALIIKVMLYFGQPIASAATLRHSTRDATIGPQEIMLVVEGSFAERNFGSIAWRLPPIGPTYRARSSSENEGSDAAPEDASADEQSRQLAEYLALPDITELGRQICRLLNEKDRSHKKVFELESETAKNEVKDLLRELNEPRITSEKISGNLYAQLMKLGRNQSLAWVTCADSASGDESRMHYTRHRVDIAAEHYAKAIATMIPNRVVGVPAAPDLTQTKAPSIGARFVANMATVQELARELRIDARPTSEKGSRDFSHMGPFDRQRRIDCHHAFTLYVWLWQSLTTSIRAITQPVQLMAHWSEHMQPLATLSDKEGRHQDKSRLVEILRALARQFDAYERHCTALIREMGLANALRDKPASEQRLFVFNAKNEPQALKPVWIESELENRNFSLPANFHRAFLRTELLERQCPAEVVDAFLGHANQGESPFSRYSTFDYGLYRPRLSKLLAEILDDVGLIAIESRLGQTS